MKKIATFSMLFLLFNAKAMELSSQKSKTTFRITEYNTVELIEILEPVPTKKIGPRSVINIFDISKTEELKQLEKIFETNSESEYSFSVEAYTKEEQEFLTNNIPSIFNQGYDIKKFLVILNTIVSESRKKFPLKPAQKLLEPAILTISGKKINLNLDNQKTFYKTMQQYLMDIGKSEEAKDIELINHIFQFINTPQQKEVQSFDFQKIIQGYYLQKSQ